MPVGASIRSVVSDITRAGNDCANNTCCPRPAIVTHLIGSDKERLVQIGVITAVRILLVLDQLGYIAVTCSGVQTGNRPTISSALRSALSCVGSP